MAKRDQLRRIMEIDARVRAGTYPHPDQLAIELEVSRRVIFKDRNYLINVLGAPLEFHPRRRGWFYSEANWVLPATMVTRGELVAFVLAIEATRRQIGAGLESELMAAVEKIAHSLPEGVGVDLEELRAHLSVAEPIAVNSSIQTLLDLQGAIEKRRVVEMDYLTASRGVRQRRSVEPHHMRNIDGEWYLWAFDPTSRKIKTFNAGRIENLTVTERGFVRQADFSVKNLSRESFRTYSGPRLYDIAIRFNAAQAIYIRERRRHETQLIEEHPDGGLTLSFRASGLEEIQRWVLQYGARAEVLAPAELRAMVQEEIRCMTQVYEEK